MAIEGLAYLVDRIETLSRELERAKIDALKARSSEVQADVLRDTQNVLRRLTTQAELFLKQPKRRQPAVLEATIKEAIKRIPPGMWL